MSHLENISQNKFTFSKEERLCSKKEIDAVFKTGAHIFTFPYKIIYTTTDSKQSDLFAKVLISVSKKNFKNAVERNRLKRLFREAYRKNKYILQHQTGNKTLLIAFLYVHSQLLDYQEIEKKIISALNKIKQQVLQNE